MDIEDLRFFGAMCRPHNFCRFACMNRSYSKKLTCLNWNVIIVWEVAHMKTFGRTGSLIRRALVLLLGIFFIGAFIYNVLPDIILIRQGRWLAHKEWLQSLHPNTIHSLAVSVLYYGIFGAISSASLLAMGDFCVALMEYPKMEGRCGLCGYMPGDLCREGDHRIFDCSARFVFCSDHRIVALSGNDSVRICM